MFQVIFCSAMQAFMYATKKNLRACPWYGSQHLKNFQLLSELSRLCSHSIRQLLRRHKNHTVSEIGSHIKTVRFRRDFCNRAKLHCTAPISKQNHISERRSHYIEQLFVSARKAILYTVNIAQDIMTRGGGRGSFHYTLAKDDCFSQIPLFFSVDK